MTPTCYELVLQLAAACDANIIPYATPIRPVADVMQDDYGVESIEYRNPDEEVDSDDEEEAYDEWGNKKNKSFMEKAMYFRGKEKPHKKIGELLREYGEVPDLGISTGTGSKVYDNRNDLSQTGDGEGGENEE